MKAILRVFVVILSLVMIYTQCEKEPDLVNIPDQNLLNALIENGVDTDGDGLISNAEAEAVISLDVSYSDISDMTGIEKFVNLRILDCQDNQLANLDVSSCPQLSELSCRNNELTSLDLSNNKELYDLGCQYNQLTSLDVSNNTDLAYLSVDDNPLTGLDVSNNWALEGLDCNYIGLSSLDVSKNSRLTLLACYGNELTNLDVSHNTGLSHLACNDNELTSLDLTKNISIYWLKCERNQLTSLDLSNCHNIEILTICENPNLEEVCVWTVPFPPAGLDIDLCVEENPNAYFTKECGK